MRNYNTDRWAMNCPECCHHGECIADKAVKGGIVRTYSCLFCDAEFDVFFPVIIHHKPVDEIALETQILGK